MLSDPKVEIWGHLFLPRLIGASETADAEGASLTLPNVEQGWKLLDHQIQVTALGMWVAAAEPKEVNMQRGTQPG
jgi:hypothetical protein